MIWESRPWKRDIACRVESLRRRKDQKRWQEVSFAKIEQDVFFCAYSVRKLMDAYKISDEVEALTLAAVIYPHCGRPVDIMNNHKIDHIYSSSETGTTSVGIRELCNQVIHSFVFAPALGNDGGLCGFYVASDRQKDKHLYFFDIDSFLDLLTRVVADEIVELRYESSKTGEPCKVISKSSRVESNK